MQNGRLSGKGVGIFGLNLCKTLRLSGCSHLQVPFGMLRPKLFADVRLDGDFRLFGLQSL